MGFIGHGTGSCRGFVPWVVPSPYKKKWTRHNIAHQISGPCRFGHHYLRQLPHFYKYITSVLKVATAFPGWNWMLRRELANIGGLSYYIDQDGMVHVSGKAHSYQTVDILGKAGIHVMICQISSDNNYSMNKSSMVHDNSYGPYGGYGSYLTYGRMDYYYYYYRNIDPPPRYGSYLPYDRIITPLD